MRSPRCPTHRADCARVGTRTRTQGNPPRRSRSAHQPPRAAACRTRSSPCGTLARFCARRVRCCPVFPLVPALGSTHSAAGFLTLFAGFLATMAGSHFSRPSIIGYNSSPSRCGPVRAATGRPRDLPVPVQRASIRARVFDHAGSSGCSRLRAPPCCLPRSKPSRHPGFAQLSRLNGRPACSPADASPITSR